MRDPLARPLPSAPLGGDDTSVRIEATTRVYGRRTIQRAGTLEPCASLMRQAFIDRARGVARAGEKHSATLHAEGSVHLLFPGVAENIPAYAVKINSKFPKETPPIRGIVLLNDLSTGQPLAILESGALTAYRTAIMGAIAADALAPRTPIRVALLGAGTQGSAQLQFLAQVRRLASLRVFDTRSERARALAGSLVATVADARAVTTPEEAVSQADLVITATWSRVPLFRSEALRPGAVVIAIGCDEAGKHEIDPELARRSFFLADDRDLATTRGLLAGAGIEPAAVHELGDVLHGRARPPSEAITVFAPVGHPFEDLVAAWAIHRGLGDEPGDHASLDA